MFVRWLVILSDFQPVSVSGRPKWKVEERKPQLFFVYFPKVYFSKVYFLKVYILKVHFLKTLLTQSLPSPTFFSNRAYPVKCVSSELLRAWYMSVLYLFCWLSVLQRHGTCGDGRTKPVHPQRVGVYLTHLAVSIFSSISTENCYEFITFMALHYEIYEIYENIVLMKLWKSMKVLFWWNYEGLWKYCFRWNTVK